MNHTKNQSLAIQFLMKNLNYRDGRLQGGILLVVTSLGLYFYGLCGSLAIAGGFLAAIAGLWPPRRFPKVPTHEASFAILLILVSLVSCLGSIQPEESLYASSKLALAIFPMLLWFSPDMQRSAAGRVPFVPWVLRSYQLGLFLLVLALLWGVFQGNETRYMTKLNRAVSFAVGFAFSVFALFAIVPDLLRRFKGDLAIIIVLLACILVMTFSSTARLGLAVGTGLFLLGRYNRKVALSCLFLMYGGMLAWPFVSQYLFVNHYEFIHKLPDSWIHRMEIWDFLYHRTMEKPLFGWGIGATPLLDRANPHGEMYLYALQSASHPHNMVFQFWVELGVAGLFLSFWLFWLGLARLKQMSARLAPFAIGAFGYYFVHAMTAFSFWSESLLGAMVLTAFSFGVLAKAEIKPLLSEKREDGRKY